MCRNESLSAKPCVVPAGQEMKRLRYTTAHSSLLLNCLGQRTSHTVIQRLTASYRGVLGKTTKNKKRKKNRSTGEAMSKMLSNKNVLPTGNMAPKASFLSWNQ
jgi:hypothetical protein